MIGVDIVHTNGDMPDQQLIGAGLSGLTVFQLHDGRTAGLMDPDCFSHGSCRSGLFCASTMWGFVTGFLGRAGIDLFAQDSAAAQGARSGLYIIDGDQLDIGIARFQIGIAATILPAEQAH